MKNKITTKTTILLAVMAIGLVIFSLTILGCKRGSSVEGENFDKDGSYAIGMSFGATLANDGIIPNIEELIQGMTDMISGKEPRFSELDAMMKIQSAYQAMIEERESGAVEVEAAFLAENSQKPGMNVTSSGLQYEVIIEADGQSPESSDWVLVNYEGRFTDGEIFDSSYERGQPARFNLAELIPGMTEAILLMNVGSKYRFFIPSELGYGPGGGGMRPFATLVFEVELLEILDMFDMFNMFSD